MNIPKWLKVIKSPKSWQSNYHIVLLYNGSRYVCSHHKTKKLAEQAATRLLNKYKTAGKIHSDYLGWK